MSDKGNFHKVHFYTMSPSCTYKKAVSSKKDEIYSISSFLFIKNCIKRYNSEYLFAQKVGQKCYKLELSFHDFPEHIGFELKQQLKIRQL